MPSTRFNSAALVRALAGLAVADAGEPKQSFAERLGAWLDFKDALALYSALNSSAAAPAADVRAGASAAAALRSEWLRTRGRLAERIATAEGGTRDAEQDGPSPALAWPAALAEAAADALADPAAPDFLPLHRYYLAQQRSLAAGIAPLRARTRAAMAGQSAALKQLAALDAVMEQALSAREASLLAQVPVLLGQRFGRLSGAHGGEAGGAREPGHGPGQWMQADGWPARFCTEMQHVLLAELDLRLMPVAGLVAALETESTERE
ncbi:DUF3348 family protein [Thauera linaloolentis]|uniref:DUF3348 family protein n=1 Tax=Thauera linaloolentis TaxID=76112 RepID=UPI001FE063D1|nr:DUF3348 family protein [Thauera linaloolentis]MCM8565805.1 DUF3348 domain-containing protein [Thauera linaloolentis]